jgi:hypothetical protein
MYCLALTVSETHNAQMLRVSGHFFAYWIRTIPRSLSFFARPCADLQAEPFTSGAVAKPRRGRNHDDAL